MWNAAGTALCGIVLAVALLKSKRGTGSYYASDVYGMTRKTHRAYAVLSVLFAAVFIAGFFTGAVPAVPLFGVYALVFIFYFSSFARGFSDEE